MNKRERETEQLALAEEKMILKKLERQYAAAQRDILNKTKILQADIDMLEAAGASDDKTLSRVRSKVYQKQHQEAIASQIGSIVDKLHSDQYSTIQEYLNDSYTSAYVGTMYSVQSQGIPLIVPIDQAAAVKAIQLDSKVSKGLYSSLGVDAKKLKRTITSEVTRGVASSLSYNDIARNISNVSKAPLSRAKTIARTEVHRIRCQASMDAALEAKKRGCDIVKQWDSTMDKRTRDSHARVDGEIKELEAKFSNGLMFPGDPAGRASEVINCRCIALTRARWALDESELEELKKRAEYFGLDKTADFEDYKKKYLGVVNSDAYKMAAESQDNDWSKAYAKVVSSKEKQQVVQYAKDRGIEIGDIDTFDGDIELLKSEVDTIHRVSKKYGIKQTITVSSKVLDDNDFAITDGHEITFNTKALRDRKVTEFNIANGKRFASRTLEDIALHETAHIIVSEKGANGIEISKKAYYNVTGKHVSSKMIRTYLDKEVSIYSSEDDNEIVAEVIVSNKNKPTEFTENFVLLLNGEVLHNENT